MTKSVLLSFDIEEFDLPKEFNQPIKKSEMYEISKKGLIEIVKLTSKHKIDATFFITANFALKYPKLVKEISNFHEIASHGYSHSDSYIKSLSKTKKAKQALEKIINKKVEGFT
jgi:peptidoglycan/xylan/chitin deacetylase (PgdA/CDA1 family)